MGSGLGRAGPVWSRSGWLRNARMASDPAPPRARRLSWRWLGAAFAGCGAVFGISRTAVLGRRVWTWGVNQSGELGARGQAIV